jgi:hypothetical protein
MGISMHVERQGAAAAPGGLIAAGAERRVFGRRNTLWHAWIATCNKQRLSCIIRNVSAGGALLELDVPLWLPNRFDLSVDHCAVTVLCDIRHRDGDKLGVEFWDPRKGQVLFDLSQEQPQEKHVEKRDA